MRKYKLAMLSFTAVTVLTACSFVSLDPQARDVNVAEDAKSLAGCKSLGNTNVSLWSKADTFQSHTKTEEQLDTLARNQAATMGGNTVVPHPSAEAGQRTYSVYNCPAKGKG
ncbi:MAG: hypothetical protein K0R14_700 [Burkholderiales bacterium]|jgi:hypothetical protein|nr:hypothetical protein [Burkholderiales bacterium]